VFGTTIQKWKVCLQDHIFSTDKTESIMHMKTNRSIQEQLQRMFKTIDKNGDCKTCTLRVTLKDGADITKLPSDLIIHMVKADDGGSDSGEKY
jgi:hypothetical protein